MFCSTVIATYNRSDCISRAIQSALDVLPQGEVVVVDDASSDDTTLKIKKDFSNQISAGNIKLICLPTNLGVTGAKNAGFMAATGDWVIFLDSDDWYLSNVGDLIISELKSALSYSIVFFRCVDQEGNFIGTKKNESFSIDIECYLEHTSFGEALTAINKAKVGVWPPYPSELRGYEGLGCARIIERYGDAKLSGLIARVYDQSRCDQLTKVLSRRMPLLVKGHYLLLQEYWDNLSIKRRLFYVIKIVCYFLSFHCLNLISKK
jgi:glycosyltransferase involved in cell wall biosynthesis